MKNIFKKSALIIIAAVLTFSACKKNEENPSGDCQLSTVTSPEDFSSDSTTFDNQGRPVKYKNTDLFSSRTITFEYNSSNQIVKSNIQFSNNSSKVYTFMYDGNNISKRITVNPYGNDTSYYTYDSKTNKLLKEIKSSNGFYYRYEYDSNGDNVVKRYSGSKYQSETLSYEYLKFDDKRNVLSTRPKAFQISANDYFGEYFSKNNALEFNDYYNSGHDNYKSTAEYNGQNLPTKIVTTLTNYDKNGTAGSPSTYTNNVTYYCK